MFTTNLTPCEICVSKGHCMLEEKYKETVEVLFNLDPDGRFRNTVSCDMYVKDFKYSEPVNPINNDLLLNTRGVLGIVSPSISMEYGCPSQFGYLDSQKKGRE